MWTPIIIKMRSYESMLPGEELEVGFGDKIASLNGVCTPRTPIIYMGVNHFNLFI